MEGCLTRLLIWILEVLYSFSSLGFPFAAQLRPQNQCECNAVLLALKAACCRKSCGLREQLITTFLLPTFITKWYTLKYYVDF